MMNKKTIALTLLTIGLGSSYKTQAYTHKYINETGKGVKIITTYYSCKSDTFSLGVDGRRDLAVGACSINRIHARVYDPNGDQAETVTISPEDRARFEAMGILEQAQQPRRYFNATPYSPFAGYAGTDTFRVKKSGNGYIVVRG